MYCWLTRPLPDAVLGKIGQADAEGGAARQPAIEEVNGEVAADPAVAEPEPLQIGLGIERDGFTAGAGLDSAVMPNGVERHAAEKQRETQAHPRRKDHGQLPRFGQEVISLRQPAVGADLVLGLDQVLHHRVGQQQSELVRLEGEQLPLEGKGVGLAVTEAGGHYLEVDGPIPRRFGRFVASGVPQACRR